MPKRLVFLLIILFFSCYGKAQPIEDSVTDRKLANVLRFYVSTLGDQSPLYNGKEYIDYSYTLHEGHPFFESRDFLKGEIHFENMIFHDVPMLYDLVKKQLITYDIRNIYKVVLPNNKIRQFTIAGHTFVRIEHDNISTGFYDQLYKGKINLYAMREKRIIEQRDTYRIDNVIDSHTTYYIFKEGTYYSFKNKRGLLDILKGKRNEIEDYLQKNNMRFKDDPEAAMIKAVEYYNK